MTYKLTYFEVKGKGEPIRMLLHAAGLEFEDKRLTFEEWPSVRETLPGRKLPILETPDGRLLRESMAICRYLSVKHGFYSSDPEVVYKIELPVSIIDDLVLNIAKIIHIKEENAKFTETVAFRETNGPLLLSQLQNIFDSSSTGFLANTPQPTLVDIMLCSVMDFLVNKHDVLLEKFPKLVQHKEKIIAYFPKLSEYMKTRPLVKF